MEKILFRKLIADITLRAFFIILTIGLIVWIIQAVNYLDFVIDDGHNFLIYFYYNLFNFPKIIHRILPFVFAISIFFELLKYEKNNELLLFWTNGVTKKKFILNLINFAIVVMLVQILIGSIISPASQLKARSVLKNSNKSSVSTLKYLLDSSNILPLSLITFITANFNQSGQSFTVHDSNARQR